MSSRIGALTTAFTPAPSCLAKSNVWEMHISTDIGAFNAYLYYLQGGPNTSDCLPSSYDPESTAFYSPGYCPQGYTPACSYTSTYFSSVTETTYTCCPSIWSFTCGPTGTTNANAVELTSLACGSQFTSAGFIPVTFSNASTTYKTTASVNGLGGLNAYGVVVRFRSGDPTGSGATATATRTTGASTTGTANPSQQTTGPTLSVPGATGQPTSTGTPSSTSGLSTGAKTGIGVGVGVGALALLIGLFLGYRWGNKRRNSTNQQQPMYENGSGWMASPASELPEFNTQRHELSATGDQAVKAELAGEQEKYPPPAYPPSELPGRRM